ncbi:MAG: hypothetical protein JO362_24560 [Streptomycetaceae bacterium]|nr:hypothetical protein [Streptomycetaceae bacterium]
MTRAQARRAGRSTGSRGAAGGQWVWVRTVAVALAVVVLGAVVDELVGSGTGWAFAVASVLGAALAAAACPPAGRVWVIAVPPLVVAVVTAVAGLPAGTGSGGKGLYTIAVHWAVEGFPAMAAAEVTAVVVLVARGLRTGRAGRNDDA